VFCKRDREVTMLFHTPIFLFLFLPLTLFAYFVLPTTWRNAVLLTASLVFYAWGEKFYVLLMITAIAFNFALGLWLDSASDQWRRHILRFGVVTNVAVLFGFKYLYFALSEGFQLIGLGDHSASPIRPIHLPIGISFFTFEAIAYLMDVSRRQTAASRSPVQFGLFMTLFPHLIAGPVVRYRDLAAGLASRTCSVAQFASGIRRFSVGLAKKMLLANALGGAANQIFSAPPEHLAASAAWLGVLCYALHIYFDFSGYSDMAIGLGRFFGFELCENFRYPYAADSITDFWRRWHISLSSWFRDYVYLPLGGNRCGNARTYANLMLVFVLCGLWHGANWTFLAWGLWHGLFLIAERTGFRRLLDRAPSMLRHLYVLLAVLGGWVFFAANSIGHALGYFSALAGFSRGALHVGDYMNRELWLVIIIGSLFCVPTVPRMRTWVAARPRWTPVMNLAHAAIPLALILMATLHLTAGTYNPFIYFRF